MTRLLCGDSLTLDLAPKDPADLLARLRDFACDDLHVFGPEGRWILAR